MIISQIPFQTRARTVDHLGREQIADVPTAISELWKNSYDAYARNVQLSIFEGESLVVAISDDGQGMTYQQFVENWLVVGTDSKLVVDENENQELFGLKPRSKQGQKGIGRLSSAHLGPLLLVVSKTRNTDFVVALVDWRIFENPYLMLTDICIPVTEFKDKYDLFNELPFLFKVLTTNIGTQTFFEKVVISETNTTKNLTRQNEDIEKIILDPNEMRYSRLIEAWNLYDRALLAGAMGPIPKVSTSEAIKKSVAEANFQHQHIEDWPVWNGESNHGTALIIAHANEELKDLFTQQPSKFSRSTSSKTRFIQTLAGFVDPLSVHEPQQSRDENLDFNYSVTLISSNQRRRELLGSQHEFSRHDTDNMEHVLIGDFDKNGVFTGHVKAFGKWLTDEHLYTVQPRDIKIPSGPTTFVGPFHFHVATYEQMISNTTHSTEELARFKQLEDFKGLRIYRDGLRVMPYGREDNDFFEIEKRRSINAGREYWNARRMFGRLAISRKENPNLRDKAGREGFIVNVAARTLRVLVVNVLISAAYDYFGSKSEIRSAELPVIQKANEEKRAKESRRKLRQSQRRHFKIKLRRTNEKLPGLIATTRNNLRELSIQTSKDIQNAQKLLETAKDNLANLRVPGVPSRLGMLEDEYVEYRSNLSELRSIIDKYTEHLESKIQIIDPAEPWELVENQLQRHAGHLQAHIRRWSKEILTLQQDEKERISQLTGERNKILHQLAKPIIDEIKVNEISLSTASKRLTSMWESLHQENEEIFENYIFALQSLTECIDLQTVAVVGMEENEELRTELDRLNALAQLGIAVEILGHELQTYDDMIGNGLAMLPDEIQTSRAGESINTGYEGLTQQMRFLSPLKLSGARTQRKIFGQEIYEYVNDFFLNIFTRTQISFEASKKFRNFGVYAQPARLFPVFINLVNNSQYWVANSNSEDKRILLDVVGELVVVADTGPGVDELDIKRLFNLFFTKKLSGGRGIGLYLCRANLAADYHHIFYISSGTSKVLSGANFAIKFKNAEFHDE